MTVTYIIKAHNGECYCNKTENLLLAVQQHRKHIPRWFARKPRQQWSDLIFFDGDHVAKIRAFGVGKFYKMVSNRKRFPIMD